MIKHMSIEEKQRVVEKNSCTKVLKLIHEALIQTYGVLMFSMYTC
jgi:hypothetical protein